MIEDEVVDTQVSAPELPPAEAVEEEPAPPPAPAPEPEPEIPQEAVEVISVDELLDRLESSTPEVDVSQVPEETEIPEVAVTPGEEITPVETSPVAIIPVDSFWAQLHEELNPPIEIPNFLEVPFEEYSVTDGLLLLILLCFFVSACWTFIKGVLF